MHTLGAWGEVLAWLLAGWMAAGWLAGGLGAASWLASPFSSVTTKHNFVNTVSFITFLFVKDFGKVVEFLLSNSMFPVLCLLCVYVFHCSCVCVSLFLQRVFLLHYVFQQYTMFCFRFDISCCKRPLFADVLV